MEEGFDRYGLVAAFSFKVQGNSQTAMNDVMKSLAGIEQKVKGLADSLKTSGVGSAFSSVAQQIKSAVGNITSSLSVLDNGVKASVKSLVPLTEELRALKAEGKSIGFGSELKDVQAFSKGTQEIRDYIAALKTLETQIAGNTAAEKEFLASLKNQQAIAASQGGVAQEVLRSPKGQTANKALNPLRDEFRALKAESQNISFGIDPQDHQSFAKGEQDIRNYIEALKILESQVQGNTAAEREFLASLKSQQVAAANRVDVAAAMRSAPRQSQNTIKDLNPLRDQFKALKAESKNINFGSDFKDTGAFTKAEQDVRHYITALKALEGQVSGNTAAEREFVATLKTQQKALRNRTDIAAATRDSAKASERIGIAQGVKSVGDNVLGMVRNPLQTAQELQGQVANIKKLADDVSAQGLIDVQNAMFSLSAKTATSATDVGAVFEDLASSVSFSDSALPQRMAEAEQILKNAAALRVSTDKATQLSVTLGSVYRESLSQKLPGFGSNAELSSRVGSSVNELADHLENVKIAASDIIPVMNVVIATLGDKQNFRVDQIAAYAAAISSLKVIDKKAAASFFSRTSAVMADKKHTGDFAETLGFDSTEEFGQALDTDKFGLIIKLIEKYKNLEGGELVKGGFLKKLGIGSVQDQRVIQGLASNLTVLTDAEKLALKGFQENVSIDTAFSKRFDTAAFQGDRLAKSFDSLKSKLGMSLQEALLPAVTKLADLTEGLIKLTEKHPAMAKAIAVGIAAFGALAVAAGTAGIALFSFQQAAAGIKLAGVALSQGLTPITSQISMGAFSGKNPLLGFFGILKSQAGAIAAPLAGASTGVSGFGAAVMGFASSPLTLGILGVTGLLIAVEKLAPQLGILGSVLGGLGAPFAFVFGLAKGFFGTIISNIAKLAGGSAGAIAEPFAIFGNALKKAMTILGSVAGSGEAVGSAIANGIIAPVQILSRLLSPLASVASGIFSSVGAGLSFVTGGIGGVASAFTSAGSLISNLWNATIGGIIGRFQGLIDAASWIGQKLVSLLAENSPGPTFQIREKWQSTLEFLSGLFGWIANAANFAGNAISSAISLAVGIVNQGLATLNLFSFQPLVDIAAQAGGLIGGIFEATIGKVGGAIASVRSLGASVASVFTQPQKAVQNLGSTIASAGGGLLASAGSTIQGAIAPVGATAEASIQAPSAGIFDALATGLEWITEKFQAFQAILAQPLTLGFAGAISGTIDWFSTSFPTSIQGFVSGLTTIASSVTETLEPAFVTIKAVIEAAFAPLSAGVNMAVSLGNTIKSFIPGAKAQPIPAPIAPVNLQPIVSPIQQSSTVSSGDAIASSINAQTNANINQSRDVTNASLSTINAIKTNASNALATAQNQLTTIYNSASATSTIAPSLEISSQIAASAEAPIVAEQSRLSSFFSNVMSRFDRTTANTLEASRSVVEKENLTSAIATQTTNRSSAIAPNTQSLLTTALPPQPDISITFPNVKPITADALPIQTSLNSALSSAASFDNAVSSLVYSATVAGDRVNSFSSSSSSAIDRVTQLARQTINAENSIANNSLSAQNNLGATATISQDLSTTAIAPITNLAAQSQNFLSSIASTVSAMISRNSNQFVESRDVLNSSSQALNASATALSNQALTQQSNSSSLASTVQSLDSSVANQNSSIGAIANSTNQASQQATDQNVFSIENFRNILERTFASTNQTQNLNTQIDSSTLENSFANSIARNTSGIQTSISQEARLPSIVNSIAVPAESHRIVTPTGIDKTLQTIANSSLETSATDRASTLTQMPGLLRAKPSPTIPTTAIAPVLATTPTATVANPVALSVASPNPIAMGGGSLNQVSDQTANSATSTQDSSLSFDSAIEGATSAIASFRAKLINQFNSQFGQENDTVTSSKFDQNVNNLASLINTNLGATTANIGSAIASSQSQTNSPIFGDTTLINALATSQTSSNAAITESTTRAIAQLAQESSQNQATIANTISSSTLNAPVVSTANSLSNIVQSAIASAMQANAGFSPATNTTLSNNTNLLQENSQVSGITESATSAIASFRTQLINQFNNQASQQNNEKIASKLSQNLVALSSSTVTNKNPVLGNAGDAIGNSQNESSLVNSLTSSQASATTALAQNTTNAIAQLSQQSAQSQANISSTIASSSDNLATQTSNALSNSMAIAQTTNTASIVAPVSSQIAEANSINVASTIQSAGDAIASFRNKLIAQFNNQLGDKAQSSSVVNTSQIASSANLINANQTQATNNIATQSTPQATLAINSQNFFSSLASTAESIASGATSAISNTLAQASTFVSSAKVDAQKFNINTAVSSVQDLVNTAISSQANNIASAESLAVNTVNSLQSGIQNLTTGISAAVNTSKVSFASSESNSNVSSVLSNIATAMLANSSNAIASASTGISSVNNFIENKSAQLASYYNQATATTNPLITQPSLTVDGTIAQAPEQSTVLAPGNILEQTSNQFANATQTSQEASLNFATAIQSATSAIASFSNQVTAQFSGENSSQVVQDFTTGIVNQAQNAIASTTNFANNLVSSQSSNVASLAQKIKGATTIGSTVSNSSSNATGDRVSLSSQTLGASTSSPIDNTTQQTLTQSTNFSTALENTNSIIASTIQPASSAISSFSDTAMRNVSEQINNTNSPIALQLATTLTNLNSNAQTGIESAQSIVNNIGNAIQSKTESLVSGGSAIVNNAITQAQQIGGNGETVENATSAIASFRNQLIAQFNSQFNKINAQTDNLTSLSQDLTASSNSVIAPQSQTAGDIANAIATSAQNKTDISTTNNASILANALTSSQASVNANAIKSVVDASIKIRDNLSFVAGNIAPSIASTSENNSANFSSTIQNAGDAIASFRSRLIERFSPVTGTTGDRLASPTNNATNQNLNAITSNNVVQNTGIESAINNAATAINTSANTQSRLVASVNNPTIQSVTSNTQAENITQTAIEKPNIATSAIATVSQAFNGFFGGLFAKAEQVTQKLKAPEYTPIVGEIQAPRFDVSSDVQKQYQQAKIDKASPQQLAVYEALLSVPDKLKSALPENAQKLQQGQFSGLQQLNPKLAIAQAKSGITGEQLSALMPMQSLQQLSAPDTQAMQVRATVQAKMDAMNAAKQPSLSDRPDKFLVGVAQQAEQQLRTKLTVIENLKTQLAETTAAGEDTFAIRYQLAQVEQSLSQVQLSPQTQTFLHTLGFSPAGIAATTNQVLSNVQNFGNEFQDRMTFYGNGGNLAEAIAPGVEQMQAGFNQLGGNVSTFSQEAFNSLKILNFEGVKNSAVTFGGAAATSISAIGAGFNSASLSAIAFGIFSIASLSPIPLIIGGIAAGVAIAATNFLGLRTIIASLVQTFYGVLDAALSVGIGIVQAVRGMFTAVGGIIPALTGDFSQLGAGVGMIFEGIQTGAGGLARGLGNVLGGAVGVVQGIFEGLGQVVRVEVLQGIINSVANFAGNIKGQIEGLAEAITTAIKRPAEVWNNFFNRAKGGARQVQNNVTATPASVEAPIASMQSAIQSAPQVAAKQTTVMQQAIATAPIQPDAIAPLEQPTKKPGLLGSLFARRQNLTDVVTEQVQTVAEQPITLQAPASDVTEIAQQVNAKTQVIDSVKVNPTISQLTEQIGASQASPVVEAIASIQQPAKKAGFLGGLFRGSQASTEQGTQQALIQQTTTPQVPNQISTSSTQQTKTSLEQSTKKPGFLGGLFARKQKPVSVVTEQTQSIVEQQPIILQASAPDVAEIAQQVNTKAQEIEPVKVNIVIPQLPKQIAVTQTSPIVEAIAQQLPTQPEAIAPIQQTAKNPSFLGGLFRRGQQEAEQPAQQLQTIVQQTVAPQIPDQISADVTQQVKASVKSPAGETVLPTAATLPAPSVAREIATPIATTPPPLPSPVARTVGAAFDVATGKAPDMLTARATRDFDMRLAGQEPEAQLTAGDRVQLASQKIETLISVQKPIAPTIPNTTNPVFNAGSALPAIDATEKKLIELRTANQQAIASVGTTANALGGVVGSVAPQIAAPIYAVGDLVQGVSNLKESLPNLSKSLTTVFPKLKGLDSAASNAFSAISNGAIKIGASVAPQLVPLLPVLGAIAASAGVLYLAFKTNFLGIGDLLTSIGSSIKGFFSNLFGGAYEIVTSVFVTIDQEMRGIFQTIGSVGQDLIKPFAPLFKLFVGESFNAGSAIIKGLLTPLQLAASTLSTLVKIVAGITKGLIVAGGAIASVLLFPLTLVSNAVVGTIGAIQGLGSVIASVGSGIIGFLFSPFQQVWNIIQAIGSGLANLPIIGQLFGGFNTISGTVSQAPAVAANPSASAAPMQAFSKGGLVQSETELATRPQPTQAFATGGLVTGPGTSTGDRVIAAVSPGEFVINAEATRQNYGLIEAINSGQFTAPTQAFSQGGLVQPQIGDRVISAINYSSASLANSFGLASSPETGSSAIAVAPPRLPQMVDPPIALASNATGISASSSAGDRPINISLNFGDIVLNGNASSPEVADEFLDRISPQLERSLRDMLRRVLEEGR